MACGIDPKWEQQLRPQSVTVAEMLRPRRNRLASRLYSKALINGDEEETFLNSTKSETDLATDILIVLRNQGPGSFDKFCDVLLEVGDDTLRGVEKSLRPSRQASIADIPSLPQPHLSDFISPDAASGLAKSKETTARGETSQADSEMVTPLIIEKVAENGSERWHEIGIYLGVSQATLTECDQPLYTFKQKLRKVLSAWTNENRQATVGQLLSACDEAKVGGAVRRVLNIDRTVNEF
ncbi:uncharacterized protein LOC134194808 [Corticium candelabrum]|uniref:uncharacterized protein LOC134194808 n=1 Tax=Corticium candelabrum TaxID=121492 RepID=UPI002E25FC0E|nr:uncharacterized protein LOC134194808 [Corticium candelabrum]